MIRLGLRLTVHAGKEAAVRLAITTAAVALGVGLLFISLAGMNALKAQNDRTAWLNTGNLGPGPGPAGAAGQGPQGEQGPGQGSPPPGSTGGPPISGHGSSATSTATSDQLWWLFGQDHFEGQTIIRIDVAATGANSPVPPGIAHLPAPGQFYASPALARLLRTTPAAQLGDRFPGRQVGTIGPAALPSPQSLIIVVGRSAEQLSGIPGAGLVSAINTDSRVDGANGWDANKLQVILAVGALALLFPVLIFIATATRLSAARREQRFAAMRLVGATPRQVSVISAVEATVAAISGVAVGFAVFFALRPVLANVAFTGATFAPGDLSLGLVDILLVAIGVPVAAVVAARIAMRRVQISPLGVTRRVTPPAPRIYRLLPLAAGIAELAYFVEVGRPKSTGGQIEAYFSGCLLMMAGLVIAGPWLTMVGSRLIVGRTSRPDVLIAGRRLSDNPRGAFRAISGLIIALFATSVSVGIITTVLADNGGGITGTGNSATLIAQFASNVGPQASGQSVQSPVVSQLLLDQLRALPGVRDVTELFADPQAVQNQDTVLASCRQLAATPALGRCAPGVTIAVLTGRFDNSGGNTKSKLANTVWPSADLTLQSLANLPVQDLVVGTTGSTAAIERARTALEVAFPDQTTPATLSEINAIGNRSITELQQLTKVVILVSLVVAGCSLAVSVTGGVSDRKRPFSLLRLTGVPVQALRRVVALEAAVPLIAIAVPSAGMGFLAAALFLRSQLGESLRPPGSGYYAIVAIGLVASLAIIGSTLPLIDRITGPEIARNE